MEYKQITQQLVINSDIFGIKQKIYNFKASKLKQKNDKADLALIDALSAKFSDNGQHSIVRKLLTNQIELMRDNTSTSNMSVFSKHDQLMLAALVIKHLFTLTNVIGFQPMSGKGSVSSCYYMSRERAAADIISYRKTDCLSIRTSPLIAVSKKLSTSICLRALQDGSATIESVALNMATEIYDDILQDLLLLGRKTEHTMPGDFSLNYSTYRFDGAIQEVISALNNSLNNIATSTRRGYGNKIITSPIGVEVLKNLSEDMGLKFVSTETRFNTDLLTPVGILVNDTETVLSVFSTVNSEFNLPNKIKFLIAYRGNSELDVGYVYAPRILITPTHSVIVDQKKMRCHVHCFLLQYPQNGQNIFGPKPN